MIKEFARRVARVGVVSFVLCSAAAGDFSVKTGNQAPPAKIAEPIRGVLAPQSIQLLEGGKPVVQIWLRRDIPLKSKPSSASSSLDSVAETSLVGVVSVDGSGLKDYKDNSIPSGVFTARIVMQPQDGDHLGTAEFNTFLALLPPDADKALDAFTKFTPMVKASGKLTASGHPMIISLRPVLSTEGAFPSLTEPASEHKAIRLKAAGKTADGESADLVFELVFEGHGHIQ